MVRLPPGKQIRRIEVVDEVCGDNPTITEIFSEVPFPTLPEADGCLQQKIHAALDRKNSPSLEWTTASIARFASAAVYDDLFTLYQQSGADWNKRAQGYMLAYLVRRNPMRGLPLLDAALPLDASSADMNIAYALGRVGYIPALDSFWRERLLGGFPKMAAQAAYQLSETGPSEDQILLRNRLDDWRAHWKGREIPPSEGQFEAELTQALMRGANWQLSKDDIQVLASGCLSDPCRTRFASTAR